MKRIQQPGSVLVPLFFFMFVCALVAGPALAHLPHDPIRIVSVSPDYGADDTLFAVTKVLTNSNYLAFRSTDGGKTWSVLPVPNVMMTGMVASPGFGSDKTLFLGTSGRGILRSEDGGETWEPCGTATGLDISYLILSPDFDQDDTVLAVNAANEFYRSTDRGGTWELVSDLKGFGVQAKVSALCIQPGLEGGDAIFLGSRGDGVFKSTDQGLTWIPVNEGLSSLTIAHLVASDATGTQSGEVFAGTMGGGVFLTLDGGLSWASCGEGIPDPDVTFLCLHPCYPEPATVFATTRAAGVYKSLDGGESWGPTGSISRRLTDQTNLHFISIAMSPDYDADQTVFLATYEGFWVSHDGGDQWEYSCVLHNRIIRDIALSPNFAADKTLAMTTYGSTVLQSIDAGKSWQAKGTGLGDSFSAALAFSPNYGIDKTLISVGHLGVQKSVNQAATWSLIKILDQQMYGRTVAISPEYATNKLGLLGTNTKSGDVDSFVYKHYTLSKSGVWLSNDGGATWVPTQLNGGRVSSLAFSPNSRVDGTAFAALGEDYTLPAGIYKSTDRGAHWARMNLGPQDPCIRVVAVSPNYKNDRTVFAGTMHGGVIRSRDGGETWEGCPGTGEWEVSDLGISPEFRTDRILFAVTLRHGLQKSRDAGNSWSPTALQSVDLTALGISPSFGTDRAIFAAAYEGLFRSTDGGDSWIPLYPIARYENENPLIRYSADWELQDLPYCSTRRMHKTAREGATARLEFVGSGVTWLGTRGPSHGMAEVYVDGAFSGLVDLYDPSSKVQQALYGSAKLTGDRHSIEIVVSGQRNPLSSGSFVSVDALDVRTNP
jgi:photosystem II stability/assembly factor-like uncharacterized protein